MAVAFIAVAVALLGAAVTLSVIFLSGAGSVPQFGSLTTSPDPSLHGTVAYFANDGAVEDVPQPDPLTASG